MVDETISEKCETLYNKLNSFVESEISRDVTPQISNLNSRIDALEPNLVRVKEVNGNTSSVSAGGTSTQTFTVPACPSGYNWEYFSTSTGWGTVSNVELSGTTLTVTLLNVSNSSHDISFSGVLMYYPKTIEAEPHISVTATNPYLLEGEVTDLVVSLTDEFGLPLTGKTVTISDGTSSYNGITNNQGVYTLSDVSVSQDTTFTATYSSVSDSIVVEYCTMVDYGVTGKSRLNYWYWDSNFGSGSVDDNGTIFTAKSTSSYLTCSALTTKIYPNPNIYIYDFPFTVEFDIVSFNDPNNSSAMSRMRIYNLTDKHNAYWNLKDYGIGHYKIVCTEGSQKLYFNGVEQSRKFTFTTNDGHWDCSFQTYGNIKLRNFRIK